MKIVQPNYFAFMAWASGLFVTACSGSPSLSNTPAVTARPQTLSHSVTLSYTGAEQTFKVPAGVTSLSITARGAEGGGHENCFYRRCGAGGGFGGRVHAEIPVRSGETLYVFVGGYGARNGGFNGGGAAGYATYLAFGGGGASDVREGGDKVNDRVLVAAGGGGQGFGPSNYFTSFGGNGGGLNGDPGFDNAYAGTGGGGGTQTQGGAGGAGTSGYENQNGQPGGNGSLGFGGNGGDGGGTLSGYTSGGSGGGGGGGYYGGGGGGGIGANSPSEGNSGPGGGGGGGSSYIEPSALKSHMWSGWKHGWTKLKGNGLVIFSW